MTVLQAPAPNAQTALRVTWQPGVVANTSAPSYYQLHRSDTPTGPFTQVAGSGNIPATAPPAANQYYDDSPPFTASTTRSYKVKAFDAQDDASAFSAVKTGTTAAVAVPNPPTGVSASASNPTTIVVSWTAGGGATADNYQIYHSTISSNTADMTPLDLDTASPYTHENLTTPSTHWYRVAAKLGGYESNQSTPSNGVTLSAVTSGWPACTPSYLPIIPGVASFGAQQFAGSGRHAGNSTYVMFVDRADTASVQGSLNTSTRVGFGSLRWCLTHNLGSNVSRTVIPLRSGMIDTAHVGGTFWVLPYTTYAGQCAPGDGLWLRDTTVLVSNGAVNLGGQVGQALLWHLPNVHSSVPNGANQSAGVAFACYADDVLFANCLVAWQQDEGYDFGVNTSNIARRCGIWQCLVMEPIDPSVITNAGHGSLIMPGSSSISMLRSVAVHKNQRFPHSQATGGVTVSNCIDANYNNPNTGGNSTQLLSSSQLINLEQNLYIHWPGSNNIRRPIWRDSGWSGSSQLYENHCRQWNTPWGAENLLFEGSSLGTVAGRISAAYPAGYVPFELGAIGSADHRAAFAQLCLAHVGPRPGARHATVQRVINHVLNVLNSTTPVGARLESLSDINSRMPTIAVTTIADPFAAQAAWGGRSVPTVANGRDVPYTSGTFTDGKSRVGYTRLEEFLYECHLLVMP